VSWNGRRLQIPESPLRPRFVKATVRIHEYPDGTVSVFWGGRIDWLSSQPTEHRSLSPDHPEHGPVLGAVKDKP
jgi:hypothetical protein